ncbi:MAG: hypothetical protein C5B57_12865 [Blastocatellia bacterium]|nr:MAG: hypothetical protein C5B57_12865 [Blastocatellia bacterium]
MQNAKMPNVQSDFPAGFDTSAFLHCAFGIDCHTFFSIMMDPDIRRVGPSDMRANRLLDSPRTGHTWHES